MEQFSGSQCRFLNRHVKLTFGNCMRSFAEDHFFSSSLRRFPYDRQNCTMKFGTWTYDSSKVNLKFYRDIERFDLENYVNSNEWTIINNSAKRHTEKYGKLK